MDHRPFISLLLATCFCGSAQAWEPPRNQASREYDGLRFTVSTDRFLYEPGQTIQLSYRVESTRDSLVAFIFGSPSFMDLALFTPAGDSLLYGWFEAVADVAVYPRILPFGTMATKRQFTFGGGSYPRTVGITGSVGRFWRSGETIGLARYCECWSDSLRAELDTNGDGVVTSDESPGWTLFFHELPGTYRALPLDSSRVSVPVTIRRPTIDFNGNGAPDYKDINLLRARFGATWGSGNYDAMFDLTGDGLIDFDDFFSLADRFG